MEAVTAEAIEAEFMYQYETGAPARDQEMRGISTRRLSGGVVLSGAEENPLAVLQIAPEVLPDDWDWIRRTRGLHEGGRIAKFAARIDGLVPPDDTDLRIAPITKDDADRWATVATGHKVIYVRRDYVWRNEG